MEPHFRAEVGPYLDGRQSLLPSRYDGPCEVPSSSLKNPRFQKQFNVQGKPRTDMDIESYKTNRVSYWKEFKVTGKPAK